MIIIISFLIILPVVVFEKILWAREFKDRNRRILFAAIGAGIILFAGIYLTILFYERQQTGIYPALPILTILFAGGIINLIREQETLKKFLLLSVTAVLLILSLITGSYYNYIFLWSFCGIRIWYIIRVSTNPLFNRDLVEELIESTEKRIRRGRYSNKPLVVVGEADKRIDIDYPGLRIKQKKNRFIVRVSRSLWLRLNEPNLEEFAGEFIDEVLDLRTAKGR